MLSGSARRLVRVLPMEVCISLNPQVSEDKPPPPPNPMPLLVVISGPSGVGKDVTLKRMKELGAPFHFLVTNTTRPRRPGEVEGVDYRFITPGEFNLKLGRGEFLEHAEVYGYQYGNSKSEIEMSLAQGHDVILRIDVQGSETIRRKVEGAVLIFMFATLEELERRLKARRTESEAALQIRLKMSATEMKEMYKFDYIVVNHDDELDRAVDDIQAVIRAEKLRVQPRVVKFL
jgi:guanylate kinase